MIRSFLKKPLYFLFFLPLLFLTACATSVIVINDVEEREANEIIVFLASRNIPSTKTASSSGGPGGTATLMFNIGVEQSKATEAMALLNQNGLPRIKGTTLLDLFAQQGLMQSATAENIRFQAGLAEQIAGMIRRIDGIIDAQVQLAFPPAETGLGTATPTQQRVTASVYVKHQGVLDDPNSHLVTKIKRLVAASVSNLDINDVTVIPDRARLADISLNTTPEAMAAQQPKDYVSIWSIVMNKQSASKFRFLFFILTFAFIVFAAMAGWLIWKFYPILRKRGIKQFFNPKPIEKEDEHPPEEE